MSRHHHDNPYTTSGHSSFRDDQATGNRNHRKRHPTVVHTYDHTTWTTAVAGNETELVAEFAELCDIATHIHADMSRLRRTALGLLEAPETHGY